MREYQTREDDELQARLAYIQYDKAMETLKDARSQVESAINDSNRSTWKGFHDMFIEDGFRKENDNYIKRTVVGATLLDSITETHTIKSYENFKTDVRDFTKDFAMPQGFDYTTIGFEGMQALLKQAMDSVPTEYARIFGERDDDGNWKNAKYEKQYMKNEPYEKPMVRYDLATQQNVFYTVEKTRSIPTVETLDYNSYVTYQKALEDLSDDERGEKGQNERIVVTGNGLFTEWVGYAPVMKPGADPGVDVEDYQKNVRFDGSGQTGRIMGMYIQHKMIEGAGWAECEQPAYNRRLWDDRGSWMKAPTLRSVADIAMTVVATAVAPGPGALLLNTALNTLDDAVFTMLDIANGMDPLAAAEGLVKKAATSYATGRINFGFANGGGILNSQLLGKGVIGETLTKGLQIGMTNVASSTINAFSVSSLLNGGPLFDGDAFMEGAFGKSAMTSVAAGMAGHAVTGGLGKIDLSDANKQALYGGVFKTGSLESFNGFMGSMAGSAVTYGMTGNATFNLAKIGGVGVMEMHLGKDGSQMNLGMSGTDVSLGTVARAVQGASEAMKVVDWKYGTLEERATLNGINVMGWTGEAGNDFNVALSKAIWERKANVRYEKMAGNGYYDQGTNTVTISNEFLGSGMDAAAKLATVMSHEGTHLAGNRIEGVAHEQGNLTYNQITAMFGLTADTAFSKSMVDAINNPASWKENTGTRDNWRVLKNGDIVDDRKDGEISFEDGRSTIYTKDTSKQGSLAEFLGLPKEKKSLLNGTIDGAGFEFDLKSNKWVEDGKTIKAEAIQKLVDKGIISTKYNNPELVKRQLEDQAKQKASEEAERKAWEKNHQEVFSKFEKDNPQVKDLIKQYDKALKSRPNISTGGCVFRDIQAVCEIASGRTLSAQQIIEVWDKAIVNNLMSSGGSVQTPDAYSSIAELTMEKLQLTGIGVEFGSNKHNGRLVGYIGVMPFDAKDTHKALYLTKMDSLKPFYNPGRTNNAVYQNLWKPVYLYSKK